MRRLSDYADFIGPETIDAWPAIAETAPAGSMLMGGTALAVHLSHRRSNDLDLFTPMVGDDVRDRVVNYFKSRHPKVVQAFERGLAPPSLPS